MSRSPRFCKAAQYQDQSPLTAAQYECQRISLGCKLDLSYLILSINTELKNRQNKTNLTRCDRNLIYTVSNSTAVGKDERKSYKTFSFIGCTNEN